MTTGGSDVTTGGSDITSQVGRPFHRVTTQLVVIEDAADKLQLQTTVYLNSIHLRSFI